MFPSMAMLFRHTSRAAFIPLYVSVASLTLSFAPQARAQEDAISAPAPLQWPTLTGPTSNRSFAVILLRAEFEKGANAELCKVLMREQQIAIPAQFDFTMCPPALATKVNNRQGKVKWASGAKPTECGMSCWGRPFMTREQSLDRPNVHYAMFFGHLDFEVENPGPNRNVRFGYEAHFRCVIPPGARDGALEISAVFGRPVIGDPSFWESVADFLVPLNISRQIEAGIRRALSTPGSTAMPDMGRCTSIGVDAPPQVNPNFDTVRFDLPPPQRATVASGAGAVSALNKSATVRFLRITRKPPALGFNSPVEPGTFSVFLNGIAAHFPETPALPLPPAGASAPINLCKTIDMNGADRLQVIFVNSLGGAVWSQFASGQKFGAGAPHLMTTGRRVVVPGQPGPPGPPGSPGSGPPKPQTLVLREFELTYTIEYHAPPSEAVELPPATGGGVRPPRAPTSGTLSADPGSAPPQPCRKI